MRKLILTLLGVAMALVACNKAEEIAIVDAKEAVYTLKVNANDGIQTRGGEVTALESRDGYTTRYILEIYHSSGDFYQRIVQYQDQAGVATPNEFNFRLVTNQQYEFLVWIDYAKSETPEADLHYNTQNLKNIAVMGDYINNDPTRDAFCGNSTVNMVSTSQTFDAITCKRPFGQLNIATTDWNHVKNAAALLPTAVQIVYKGYRSFNVSAGVPIDGTITDFTYKVGDIATKQPLIGDATNEGVQKLTCDYLFASSEGFSVVGTKITFYNGDGAGNKITDTGADLENLPIKRNYKTNVSGNLLTKKGDITVKVDAEWSGNWQIFEMSAQLANEMNSASDGQEEYLFQIQGKTEPTSGHDISIVVPAKLQSAKKITFVFAGGFNNARPVVSFAGGSNYTFTGELCVLNKTLDPLDYSGLVTYNENHTLTFGGKWASITAGAKTINILHGASVGDLGISQLTIGKTVNIYGQLNRILAPATRSEKITIYMKQGATGTPSVRPVDADAVDIVNER